MKRVLLPLSLGMQINVMGCVVDEQPEEQSDEQHYFVRDGGEVKSVTEEELELISAEQGDPITEEDCEEFTAPSDAPGAARDQCLVNCNYGGCSCQGSYSCCDSACNWCWGQLPPILEA